MSDLAESATSSPLTSPAPVAPAPCDKGIGRSVSWWRWTHGLANRLAQIWDATLLFSSFMLGWLLQSGDARLTAAQAVVLAIIGTVSTLVLLKMIGAYRVERYRDWIKGWVDMTGALIPSAAVVFAIALVFLPDAMDHTIQMGHKLAVVAATVAVGRIILALATRQLLDSGRLKRRVVVFGATVASERVVQRLRDDAHRALYDVVALFDDRADDRRPSHWAGMPVMGDLDEFKRFVASERVDMIIIALPWSAALRIHALLTRLQMISLDVVVPLDEDNFKLRFAQICDVAGQSGLMVMRQPLRGSQIVLKRIEDIVVSGLGLLAVSPVLALAALAIRLESPGPVLFRQARQGFNDRNFMMLKLRSMTVDPNDDGRFGTAKNNPRVTRVGAILRKTSLDELPQLWNVLVGDMSIVGPRAHVPNMLVRDTPYDDAVREYAGRCKVKPGITGWAQVNGSRGIINSLEGARRRVEYDIDYIENWSLWLDIKIMVRTLLTGMFGKHIY